jgi:uncharacterized radical SAM protein YgiQ
VGGPTANFYGSACQKQKDGGFCADRECLFPSPCPALKANHGPLLEILAALRGNANIKKVFIRSGLRFDFMELDSRGDEFLDILCRFHISGQLKTAPEHISAAVLAAMGKTGDYERFRVRFFEVNKKTGLRQYLIPYFITGHPGCTMADAEALALYLKKSGFVPAQVQDFYPTPGTLSTVMYRTGLDPRTEGKSVYVPGGREKRLQKALLKKA